MPYYHIKITHGTSSHPYREYDYELNLSEEDARVVAEQYESKKLVLFKGKWVNVDDIEEIEIRETPEKTSYYFPQLSLSTIFESSQFPNVTRRFVKSPPEGRISAKSEKARQPLSKNIFIVHGRDKAPAFELARLLEREFKLETTLLQEQPHGGRTLIEKLEDYSNIAFAFVIVTPDDVGGLKGEELRERPRQNVVLEWGHFIAKIGRNKTCILLKGDIELPSDMQGVGFHRFYDSVEEVFLKIKRELKNAGFIN